MSRRSRLARRVIATSAVVAAAVPLVIGPANAAISLRMGSSASVRSASWGAVATPAGSGATSGTMIINWSSIKGVPYEFIELVNTGTLDLSGATYTVTTIATQNGNQKLPSVTLDACSGGSWAGSSNTCSGTTVRLGSTVSGSFSGTVGLSSGGRLSVRATSSGSPGANFATTLSVKVSRNQARAGRVTNQ